MARLTPRSDDIEEAAALWYARMTSELKTPADEAAFEAWLARSPEHREAYAEVCVLSGRFDAIANHPEIAAFRVEAQLLEERLRRPLFTRLARASAIAGFAAAAAVAAFFIYFNSALLETDEWTTPRGETMEITLSDGSEVALGSDSRLEMRFRRGRRDLELKRGHAFFDVAHDADRPFVVLANGRTVTALGTEFDVHCYLDETTVTLVRGRVAIARDGEVREIVLEPGQQFHAHLGVASVRDVDAVAQTSWRTGMLEFDGATLSDAVTEFNRNAPRSIVIADPRLSDLRVSGVFRASDPQGFAAALVPAYPVTASSQSSGDIVLTYREGGAAAPH